MRLVCPNCDAEYEVDAAVIPDMGRDVQCSNCGHAWFQISPEAEAAQAAEDELYEAPPAPAPTPLPEPASRGLDESVLAVLREEAERETKARIAEAKPNVETQTELGLQAVTGGASIGGASIGGASDGANDVTARRVARLKGVDPDAPARGSEAAPARAPTRRELLPEIDEINSSLRAASEKRSGGAAVDVGSLGAGAKRGSAFRSGFLLVALLGVVGTAVYAMAPRIVEQFPAAAPTMAGYVETVDAGRIWLDQSMRAAIGWLKRLNGGAA